MKTPGQLAYEADCAAEPLYGDGTKRKAWAQLSEAVRETWKRNPTPRERGGTWAQLREAVR